MNHKKLKIVLKEVDLITKEYVVRAIDYDDYLSCPFHKNRGACFPACAMFRMDGVMSPTSPEEDVMTACYCGYKDKKIELGILV
jgi:hypothetical protein